MLTRVFAGLLRVPRLRKALWRNWYQFLARTYRSADWTFMNYGFADEAAEPLTLAPGEEKDRYCIQLYNYAAGSIDLRGSWVVEVGCGRGGGASFIARYLGPRRLTGVDLSSEAIAYCRRTHTVAGLDFRFADAEMLPFDDSSVDAVVNIESSHCYPSLPAFFNEVRRILKPQGYFLYADLRERNGLGEWRNMLAQSGLIVTAESDITTNVLRALDRDNERKRAMIGELVPRFLQSSFGDFAALRDSRIYNAFRTGGLMYGCFVAQKTSTGPGES
jgi:SAM-dependent methyltransferase